MHTVAMLKPPRVSVILPTLDGEQDLVRLLPALKEQDFDGELEIRAIDSHSTDGTRELLQRYGATIQDIPRSEFGHGSARNRCAAGSEAEFLVFLSQDAVPADGRFLSTLLDAFQDRRVAGAYSRVLPHPEDDPLTCRTVLELPEASDEPFVRDLDEVGGGVWDLGPEERGRYLRFNNVASAIRNSVFREIPFPDTRFAEDFAWAARALTAGHRIAFVPDSVVYHAHAYNMRSAFERYRIDSAFHEQVHGWKLRPTALSAARGFLYEVGRDMRYLAGATVPGRVRHILRSPGLRAAQVLGQYMGSKGRSPRFWKGKDPAGSVSRGALVRKA